MNLDPGIVVREGANGKVWESPEGVYRYALEAVVDPAARRRMAVIGLNPSTADEKLPDPTFTRCKGFAAREGMRAVTMLNLFPYRSTDPKVLGRRLLSELLGTNADDVLTEHCGRRPDDETAPLVVVAWGAPGDAFRSRVLRVVNLVSAGFERDVFCLGVTKSGQPRHPLYLASITPLERWTVPAGWSRDVADR